MIKDLAVSEVEFVAFRLAREKMTYNEPIPEFATRFPNILESCLAVPFQRFQKRSFYRGIVEKAAILFYLLIKNHPFQNGNKRIAMTILFVFLYKNKKWLKVDNRELYNFAVWVAESNPRLKTDVVAAVQKFIETCLVSL